MTASPTVTVVIPTLNEAANLRAVLPTLPPVAEVILVDGGSVDGTVQVAKEVMPQIRVIEQTRKGKGNALACGFAAATSDVVVMFDADGSAVAEEIPRYVEALVSGADFAKGSRFIPGGDSDDITALRRAGNSALQLVFNAAFRHRFTDLCYGYNAFWVDLVPTLDLPDHTALQDGEQTLWGDGFEIEALIACRMSVANVRIAEVPSHERRRIHGQSNLRTFSDGFRVLRTICVERARARHKQSIPRDINAIRGRRASGACSPAGVDEADSPLSA